MIHGSIHVFLGAGILASGLIARLHAAPVPTDSLWQVVSYRNAVRLDVGGSVVGSVANLAVGSGDVVFPVLASYERQLDPRLSVVVEGVLNGGFRQERKAGVSVQGRCYVRPGWGKGPLASFYAAPIAAYRAVRMTSTYELPLSRLYLAIGALVGWQCAWRPSSRWFADIAAGLMNWKNTGADRVNGARYTGRSLGYQSYYDTHRIDFDGRLGVGYRF